jgi:hypothetical protein
LTNENLNQIRRHRIRANEGVQAKDGAREIRSLRCHTSCVCRPYRIALILALASLLSAWTCSAVVNLDNCHGAVPYPQIDVLSPNPISADMLSVVLTVEGRGFVPQSEILWNQNPLPTIFIDSRHLQTTITQETFESYGGSAGKNVWITVTSPGSAYVVGCANGGNSSSLLLEIY